MTIKYYRPVNPTVREVGLKKIYEYYLKLFGKIEDYMTNSGVVKTNTEDIGSTQLSDETSTAADIEGTFENFEKNFKELKRIGDTEDYKERNSKCAEKILEIVKNMTKFTDKISTIYSYAMSTDDKLNRVKTLQSNLRECNEDLDKISGCLPIDVHSKLPSDFYDKDFHSKIMRLRSASFNCTRIMGPQSPALAKSMQDLESFCTDNSKNYNDSVII